MDFFAFLRKKTFCGLDLGQSWAKAVKLSPGRQPYLTKLGRIAWEKSDWQDKQNIAARLNQFWKNLEFKEKIVLTSMAGHDVMIKRVDLPFSGEKFSWEDINKHAQEYIPFNINDVYIDFQEMGEGSKESSKNVLLVASKQQMVHDLQNLLQQAGLQVSVVDVDGFALSNCFEFNYPDLLSQTTYLLDIGETHSTFCVFSQNRPIFVRDISFGGQQITEKLKKNLHMSNTDIEKFKISGFYGKEDTNKAKLETEEIYSSWSEEIQHLINFYQNSQQNAQAADKLMISGGGSLIPGLKHNLATYLDMETEYINPWRQIQYDDHNFDPAYLNSIGPQFAICVGLALRTLTHT